MSDTGKVIIEGLDKLLAEKRQEIEEPRDALRVGGSSPPRPIWAHSSKGLERSGYMRQ